MLYEAVACRAADRGARGGAGPLDAARVTAAAAVGQHHRYARGINKAYTLFRR